MGEESEKKSLWVGCYSGRKTYLRVRVQQRAGISDSNPPDYLCQSCASTGGIRWHILASPDNLARVVKRG